LASRPQLVDDGVEEVPQVGDQLAARHQAEVERVEVALHGDVEPLPVEDRRHRVVVQHLRPGGVERLAGPGTLEITTFTGGMKRRR
jgi:hypothetical protein